MKYRDVQKIRKSNYSALVSIKWGPLLQGRDRIFRQDTSQVVTAASQRQRCNLTNGFKPILLQRHKPLKNTEKHFYIFVTSRMSTLLERGTGPAYKSSNSLSPFSTFKSLKVESVLR